MGSPIDVGGQYPFITFFTPPRLSGKFLLGSACRNLCPAMGNYLGTAVRAVRA